MQSKPRHEMQWNARTHVGQSRHSNSFRQPLHQLQWSTRKWAHSEHFIRTESRCCGQKVSPLRASYGIGLTFAGQFSAEHRSNASVLLAGPFCRRALYNPNFKALTRCAALPPSMPLISSRTEAVVPSVFSSVPMCFHPVTITS